MTEKFRLDPEFLTVLKQFIKKFFHGRVEEFDIQHLFYEPKPGMPKWGFYKKERTLTQEDLIDHFYKAPLRKKYYIQGSLSFKGVFKDNIIKWFMIDMDSWEVKKKTLDLVLPALEKDGFDYLIEQGGTWLPLQNDYSGGKIWVFGEAKLETATEYVRQLFYKLGEPIFAGADELLLNKKREFNEIFPINKPDNKGRCFLGPHLKRLFDHETLEQKEDVPVRYPCIFKGEESDDPKVVLNWVVKAKPFTEDRFKSLIDPNLIRAPEKPKKDFSTILADDKQGFMYDSLNLPLPTHNFPYSMRPVLRNCQAINQVVEGALDEGYVDKRGDFYHNAGFYLAGLMKYHDNRWDSLKGKDWFDWLVENFRTRGIGDHNWWLEHRTPPKEQAYMSFPSCAKWEERFGLCNGCPFQGKIKSPREILNGSAIKKETVGHKILTTPQHVRDVELPILHNKVLEMIDNQERGVVVSKHPPGCFKSSQTSEVWIPDLVRKGKRVLLAVPLAALALEHAARLKAQGITSFILMSHENIFGHQADPPKSSSLADFDCPHYDEIQEYAKLGVSSGAYKNEFCKNCPFYDNCYYPKQYTQVKEEKYDVVIIQHAHFSCQEVIFDLMEKNFDVLYIDEYFLDNVYQTVEIKQSEIALLKELDEPWADKLVDWLEGKTKKVIGKINPNREQLSRAQEIFLGCKLDWRIPEYIKFYNQHRTINPVSGIEVIYELPRIPIQVWTDGTAPLRLIKQLTGMDSVFIYGENQVIDIEALHPDNKRYQLLDFNPSRKALENKPLYQEILLKIGEIIEYEKNLHKKVLIVVYKDNVQLVKDFLSSAYPVIKKKIETGDIVVTQKSRGINKYAHFDMQFTLLAVNLLGRDYQLYTYQFKQVANYYREKRNLPPLTNPYPYKRTTKSSIGTMWAPIQRVMKKGNRGTIVKFEQFKARVPLPGESPENESFWHSCIYDNISASDIEQAERIRWIEGVPKEHYLLVDVNTNLLITDCETISGFLEN